VASLGFGHAPGIVRAAREAGVRRSVFFSTAAVKTELPSATKPVRLEAERVVLEGGIGATLLRPTMIYGAPGDRNLERLVRFVARRRVVPIPGTGKGLQQPVHVEDVAQAAAKAFPREDLAGRTFDVPGPEPMTFEELVRTVARVLGKRRWFPHVPAAFARLVASKEQVARLAEDKSCDPRPAGEAFGHAPRAFEAGIREEARALGLLPAGGA
jgi:nucleoside-diphosphate-sugar epimerase